MGLLFILLIFVFGVICGRFVWPQIEDNLKSKKEQQETPTNDVKS